MITQTSESAFLKRVKRNVTGREKEFFASTSPGLESVCLNEIKAFSGAFRDFTETQGGVQFKGRINDCFSANLNLRTASRILMRIGEFKATNFMQLEKKLSGFPWELYLPADSKPGISISTRKSRLYHKDAIAGIFSESIVRKLGATGTTDKANIYFTDQQVFVRASNDRFVVSLDSSGELLYRRGIKTHRSEAPLRETTAAAILAISGYEGTEPLLDPMCGSGTFSIEAAMISQNIPAGIFREFSFMNWPCFEPKRWAHIKRKAESGIKNIPTPRIFASDIDSGACNSLLSCIKKHEFLKTVEVAKKDFFDIAPTAFAQDKGLVVLNPPYGHRMGKPSEGVKLFHEICDKLKKDFSGWKIALLCPDAKIAEKVPLSLKTANLFHGGLKISLLYGNI